MEGNQSPIYSKTSNLAIISLIAGILGWLIPIIGAIIAIITGHKAKGEIRDSGDSLTGDGIATVGLVLGYAQLIIPACAVGIIVIMTLLGPGIEDVFNEINRNI